MLNMAAIDNINSTSSIPFNFKYIDKDELEQLNEQIKNQYINFNNLGVDLLENIDNDDYKREILVEFANFVNENYTSIIGFNSVFSNTEEDMAKMIYSFFCVDCVATILPNYINQIQCFSIGEFENYIKYQFKYEQHLFKNSLLVCIRNILDQILNLSKIDKNITKDNSYQLLVKKYSFFLDLIDFGDANNLLNNYIRPVLNKYMSEILWRST